MKAFHLPFHVLGGSGMIRSSSRTVVWIPRASDLEMGGALMGFSLKSRTGSCVLGLAAVAVAKGGSFVAVQENLDHLGALLRIPLMLGVAAAAQAEDSAKMNQGASENSPGHQMQNESSPGASEYAPGRQSENRPSGPSDAPSEDHVKCSSTHDLDENQFLRPVFERFRAKH